MLVLHIIEGPERGETFKVLGETQELGRHGTLRLTDSKVSRRHAAVTLVGQRCFIHDLGSRHGTFVNGARIDASTPLRAGDHIRLGHTVLQVLDPLRSTAIAPENGDGAAIDEDELVALLAGSDEVDPEADEEAFGDVGAQLSAVLADNSEG